MMKGGDFTVDLYPFYKTPDGQECLPKTYHYTKYSTVFGTVFSVYEIVLVSKPMTLRACLARMGHFILPFAGMGFAFGSSLCLIAQLRGTDDVRNHAMAGAIAGTIWGAKYRSLHIGHNAVFLLGFTAAYIKYFKVNNYPLFTQRKPEYRYNVPDMDFSIKFYDDPGRGDRA